jgi:hypothetical protein
MALRRRKQSPPRQDWMAGGLLCYNGCVVGAVAAPSYLGLGWSRETFFMLFQDTFEIIAPVDEKGKYEIDRL